MRENSTMPTDPHPDTSRDREWGFRTRAIHAGAHPEPVTGARAVPIFQTSSFVFENTADAADLFALQKFGNIYTRISNPTVAAFEERVASLEGGIGAVATSSGMSAEFMVISALCEQGDHVVSSAQLYGGTRTLLEGTLARFGVSTTFVAGDQPADFAAAIQPNTKMLYTEVVANPSGVIADLEGLAAVARDAEIPLVVDSTVATPYLCRPISWGADIVVHSATKFMGGHGTSLGGVVVESGRFDWGNGKFPRMTESVPSYGGLSWWSNFGEYAFCMRLRAEQLRDVGATLSPFNAFLLMQGVETLPQRMEAHLSNAYAVADALNSHPGVAWVRWAGLPDNPYHDRALKYLPLGPGSVFSFGVVGGRAGGRAFIEALELCSHLANIGDTKTLVIHPASTTHRQLSDEALAAGGVPPDLIRISVGIEDADDIIWDIERALDTAVKAMQ
jgi:O-acetylhomoserine (thiol)-lyase